VLAARADGTKIKPYVVFKGGIREVKAMKPEFKDAAIATSKNGWMNDELTQDWITAVYGKFAFAKRMLVWDSYKCHISDAVKKHLLNFNTLMAVIPGGCTKYIQAPDVCWNKPFKDHLRESYEDWMENGEKFYTKGGNLKAPSKRVIVSWVISSWNRLSADHIRDSFQVCGLNLPLDGSEDSKIHCMKGGGTCTPALALLKLRRLTDAMETLTMDEEDDEEEEKNEIVIYDSEDDENRNSDFGSDSDSEDLMEPDA